MFEPGTIIYFTPFYFKDGGSKNKYFLTLCQEGPDFVVASLPSSQDYVPAFAAKSHGCIDVPEGNFNCYYFEPGKPVTTRSWAFPKPTYIYANWIDSFSKTIFRDVYVVEQIDYEIIGRLTKEEYDAIISCFIRASNIKRKYRRLLETVHYS